eukprot:s3164_g1.t2
MVSHRQDVQQSERLQALLSELDEPWPLREQALGDAGTYGELKADGVAAMLDFFASLAPLGPDDVFVDLGSGRGRVSTQVVLQSPAHAVGIELSMPRATAASRLQVALQRRDEESSSRLTLLQGDFRDLTSWSSATLVYVNSAAFPAKLLFDLRAAFQRLQPGALVLTVRRLPGCTRGLWPLGAISLPFSWSRDVAVNAYMVAPRPSAFHEQMPWLVDMNITGEVPPFPLPAGSSSASRRLQASMDKSGASPESWLRSWLDGPADLQDSVHAPPSATRCGWREFHAQHELHRRGALPTALPGSAFAKALGDLALTDSSGSSLLHHAAAAAAPAALAALLSARRDDYARQPQLANAVDQHGDTPLNLAADNQSLALLLKVRADPSMRPGCCPGALLAGAVRCMDDEFLLSQLEHGNLHERDEFGATALHHAARCSHQQSLTLLQHGAASDVRDADGRTPLHFARNANVVRGLLLARSDLNARDVDASTPLHLASTRRGGAEVVTALLAARADPEARDSAGLTAADRTKQKDVLDLLAHAGSSPACAVETKDVLWILDPKDGRPQGGTRILDPCAKCLDSRFAKDWNRRDGGKYSPMAVIPDRRALYDFDWQGVKPPGHHLKDLVIYETHVRGFTRTLGPDMSDWDATAGTFLGFIQKIPHLLKLGINAVELLPVYEFDETACPRTLGEPN